MKNLIVTTIGLAVFLISAKGQFSDPQIKDNVLFVKGTAIIRQIPENISVSINIKYTSKDYSDCQDKLLAKMVLVKSSLKKQNISEDLIKTDEMSVQERVDYIEGKMVHNGFNGNITVIIESTYSPEFSKKLLTALKSDSLVLDYNIGFKLSEAQKSRLRKETVSLAIEDAKEKAALIAKTSNVGLVKINSIKYSDDEFPFYIDRDIIKTMLEPTPLIFAAAEVGASAKTSIDFNPKEIGIIKTVQIEWTIDNNPNKN